MRLLLSLLLSIVMLGLQACDDSSPTKPTSRSNGTTSETFTVLSGSENTNLEPMIQQWATRTGVDIRFTYKGSIDISHCLETGTACPYDAVWPANGIWIALGDTGHVVKHEKSIYRSPVVLGIAKSIAEKLGWVNNPNVPVEKIIAAAEQGAFKLGMTSCTQSNSGASACLAFLRAIARSPDALQQMDVNDPAVQTRMQAFLATVHRGSGSSDWLKDLIVQNPDSLNAMINYESLIIEANRGYINKHGEHVAGLVEQGREPLCAIYPTDGLMVADSPLGYIDHGSATKESVFHALQAFLLSAETQHTIEAVGRRTGLVGMQVENPDTSVWNPNWCIAAEQEIVPVPTPSADVIRHALNVYQTGLRKPSLTVWVLDLSGSMAGDGIDGIRAAMHSLLDKETAARNLLQIGPKDITIVVTFSSGVRDVWKVEGNSPGELVQLLAHTQAMQSGGGTAMYDALQEAVRQIVPYHTAGTLGGYLTAINAMTDGVTNEGARYGDFVTFIRRYPFMSHVPVNTIAFGAADTSELSRLSQTTVGRHFDSHGDLPGTLRAAKGYN